MKMLNKFKIKLKESNIVKNIVVLVSGVVIGYGISTLTLPIVSRVYTPAQLGEYDLILSVGNILINFVGLALIIAIMIPNEDEEAIKICKVIRSSAVILLGIFMLGVYILEPYVHLFEVTTNYHWACWLMVFYVWTYNQQNLYYAFVNRKRMYRVLFWNPIFSAITNSLFSIIFGLWGWGTSGYLLGTILSYVICILHMRIRVNPFRGKHSVKELWTTLKNYRVYPLVQLPTNTISTVSTQIPTQFLGRMFSTAALGGYTMACKLLSVPVSLLATPVNRVYYREAAEKKNRGENIGELCFNIIEKNVKLAILPIGILVVFGRQITTIFLGQSWEASGTYISILGILYLLKYCSSCVSGTFVVIGKQKVSLVCSICGLLLYLGCFIVAYFLNMSVIHTILFYAVTDGLYNFINLLLCMIYTKFSIKRYLIFVLKYIFGSAIVIYGLYFII